MLGTTKPPYTLALLGALLREAGCEVRLVDATAERLDDRRRSWRGSTASGFAPTLILFPTTTPTLDADVAAMARAQAALSARRCSASARTPRRRRPSRWRARRRRRHVRRRARRRHAAARRARRRSSALGEIPSLTWRAQGGAVVPHRAHGSFAGFLDDAVPGLGPARARALLAAAGQQALRASSRPAAAVRTPATSASPRFTRGTSSASAAAKALVDQIERSYRELGRRVLLPLGRHGHAEREVVHARSATS